jgi:hypothetical protein
VPQVVLFVIDDLCLATISVPAFGPAKISVLKFNWALAILGVNIENILLQSVTDVSAPDFSAPEPGTVQLPLGLQRLKIAGVRGRSDQIDSPR